MYLCDIAQLWLKKKKDYIKESTYAFYKVNMYNYIIPYFGDFCVSDITNQLVQDIVNYWQRRPDVHGDKMRWSSIKNVLSMLKQILLFAQNELGIETIASKFDLHPIMVNNAVNKKVWSIHEQHSIVNFATKDINTRNLGIILAISCGLRIGEICALQWKDIDVDTGVIYIRKTLQRIYLSDETPKSRLVISTPKTFSSIREIPISIKLREQICRINQKTDNNFVLTNSTECMEPRTYRKYFKKFLQDNNIDSLNFHCLRHSFATRCITNGSDIKVVSELLGHSTVNTTWNMYVHPSFQEKQRCVELSDII